MLLQLQMLLQLKILDLGTGSIAATQHHEYHDGWLRSHQPQLPAALPKHYQLLPTTQISFEKTINLKNHKNMQLTNTYPMSKY